MEFGEYLRALRKSKGLTLCRMEKTEKLNRSYLSQIERGEKSIPSPEIIRSISNALGVSYIGMMIKAGYLTEEEVLFHRSQNGIED